MTKERGILFTAENVLAVMNGTKTQTRRIIKSQPIFAANPKWSYGIGHSGEGWYCGEEEYPAEGAFFYRCPYGKVGGLLYVKESWGIHKGFEKCHWSDVGVGLRFYRADYEQGHGVQCVDVPITRWRSARFMPKLYARTWLRITDIRVERIQDISVDDSIAEGVKWGEGAGSNPRVRFSNLWDSINLKRGHGWDVNDWVWVYDFELTKPPSTN